MVWISSAAMSLTLRLVVCEAWRNTSNSSRELILRVTISMPGSEISTHGQRFAQLVVKEHGLASLAHQDRERGRGVPGEGLRTEQVQCADRPSVHGQRQGDHAAHPADQRVGAIVAPAT